MSKLRQLIEAANRKCETAWKVYSYNPEKDNELVDTSKAFDCIAAAQAHKRDILEKNPNYTVEIIAEAVAKARIDIGNDDIDDAYMDVNYAISRDTNYKLKDFKKEAANIDVKNPGVLEVPDGKKVDELPQSHFEKLVDKKGYAEVIRALTNLEVWNKDKNKSLSSWASNMADKLKKKFRPESAQKSESKVNMSKLKNEIQVAVNKYFKDDKDLLEYVHIDTKKDKLGRDILEVRAELGYNDMVKLADHLDKIVTKYDRYAYFDQETSGIMTAVFESVQKNEGKLTDSEKQLAKQLGIEVKKSLTYADVHSPNFKPRKGNFISLHKNNDGSFEITISTDRGSWHQYGDKNYPDLKTASDIAKKAYKNYPQVIYESAQKNEDTRQWHKLSDITKDDKPFIVIGKKDSSNGYYINVVSSLYDLTNFSNGIWFDLDDKAFNTKEQAYDRAKKSYPKAKVIFANKKDFSNTRLSKYANESAQINESLRDLNLELADDTNAIAASADKIRQRFEYRTLQNQSYDEKQAEKIYLEVRRELEKAKKMIDACYNKIG